MLVLVEASTLMLVVVVPLSLISTT